MLSRAARPAIAQLSCRNGYEYRVFVALIRRVTIGQTARGMATLREIEQRLKVIPI